MNLSGKKVLITAGPTREKLDPIRFISNKSSGRMGAELGKRAVQFGASHVYFIHGPIEVPVPDGVEDIPVESAIDMLKATQKHFADTDISIFCSAVANYRPKEYQTNKVKAGEEMTLTFVRNPDIAKWCGENKTEKQILVGFTAETEDLLNTAKKKLVDKKLDMIFANLAGVPGIGFQSSDNEVTMIDTLGNEEGSGKQDKSMIAHWIWGKIYERF